MTNPNQPAPRKIYADTDAIRLVHELAETMLLFHNCDDLVTARLEAIRDHVREMYDESVWKP